jgi:hypothetical protein
MATAQSSSGIFRLGLIVGNGNGIGAGQPAGEIEIAAAIRAEGVVFAVRRAACIPGRACLAQRLDLGGGFSLIIPSTLMPALRASGMNVEALAGQKQAWSHKAAGRRHWCRSRPASARRCRQALDAVGAGLAAPLARGEIAVDLVAGQPLEANLGLDDLLAQLACRRDQADAGIDPVAAAGEQMQRRRGLVDELGLAENAPADGDDGIGGKDIAALPGRIALDGGKCRFGLFGDSRAASERGCSDFFGVSSISIGIRRAGSMPAWRAGRRGAANRRPVSACVSAPWQPRPVCRRSESRAEKAYLKR